MYYVLIGVQAYFLFMIVKWSKNVCNLFFVNIFNESVNVCTFSFIFLIFWRGHMSSVYSYCHIFVFSIYLHMHAIFYCLLIHQLLKSKSIACSFVISSSLLKCVMVIGFSVIIISINSFFVNLFLPL